MAPSGDSGRGQITESQSIKMFFQLTAVTESPSQSKPNEAWPPSRKPHILKSSPHYKPIGTTGRARCNRFFRNAYYTHL